MTLMKMQFRASCVINAATSEQGINTMSDVYRPRFAQIIIADQRNVMNGSRRLMMVGRFAIRHKI
jgi:hypothetical protein